MTVKNIHGDHQLADATDRSVRGKITLGQASLISLASSSTGASLVSITYVLVAQLQTGQRIDSWLATPVIFLFVALTSAIFALPASLIIGISLIVPFRKAIRRWPTLATLALALAGSAFAYPIDRIADSGISGGRMLPWFLVWGGAIGAMHGIFAVCFLRRTASAAIGPFVTALVVTPLIVTSAAHLVQNAEARSNLCVRGVYDIDRALASRADRALRTGGTSGARVTATIGGWQRFDEGSSRAYSYSAIFVNGQRAIAINDEANLPQSLLTDVGYESPVENQCMASYVGPHAGLIRRILRPVKLIDPRHHRHSTETATIVE